MKDIIGMILVTILAIIIVACCYKKKRGKVNVDCS